MKSTRLIAKTALTVGLLGAALTIGVGSAVTDAEAQKPRIERGQKSSRGDRSVQNRTPSREKKAVRSNRSSREGKVVRQHKGVRHREPVREYRRGSGKPIIVRDHARHRSIVRHRPVVRHHYPRVVRRPWHTHARRIHVHRDPFYFHTGFGIYFGGLFLNVVLGDVVAEGYIYRDPYCDLSFYTVDDYHRHLTYHDHYPALEVVAVNCY